MSKKLTGQYVHRSSRSGQFVTPGFAKRHKTTTQREHVMKPVPQKKRRRRKR
jgi:hypothetical protein